MTRPVEGILNVDKPGGMTSHDVANCIRRVSGLRRVGHTGTLDPLATGVLLVCVGRATRLSEYLTGRPKSYEATIRLGQETRTYDAEGEIVAERPVTAGREEVVAALEQFRGVISQVPPMFSAIRHQGQPLYKLARQGVELERPARQVTVYQLELLRWELPDLDIRVICSAGTYIRSIAHDLGQALGYGGHLAALRRTAVGDFTIAGSVALAVLNEGNWLDYLLPTDTAVRHLPELALPDEETLRLGNGQPIPRRPDQPDAPTVRVYDSAGRFVGVAARQDETWQPHKIFYQPPNAAQL
ncbi:MAG: tRNA pseudouridine(55) synthase TruB [Chloroflexi bacterium]|nr:tRNA pseudouridine(55) synthase TruB [Chloroflexota bacterium]MCI0575123.1 tRNA pseudouridine(55) synthase TruB [Chloroflexota bacterium]MCI0646272.1 tRNA pseudouridine(55) synthase TruB [Chloroflexota bacterium]MCI0728617.1 tRNA pseudouridine(55) synthase TruB [Chloroflexota bacterium]